MMSYCVNGTDCPYRTDTGYCRYTGNGCVNSLVRSIRIDEPSYKIVQQVDISNETIEKIADAVVKKLHQMEGEEA